MSAPQVKSAEQGNRILFPTPLVTDDGKYIKYDHATGSYVLYTPGGAAEDVTYDNSESGLTADDVQAAIDEIVDEMPEAYTLPQATDSTLGGIKAAAKTTETQAVAIDSATGILYVPATGAAANGLPASGTEDQILAKNSATDYDAKWVDAPAAANGVAAGGTTGQVYIKKSATDYDCEWDDAPSGSASPLTTKGDLFVYGSADARLPVGTDGHSLLADSGETLGVKWGVPHSNKNLLHNWDFRNPVNQRGASSYSGASTYSVDRWQIRSTLTVTVNTGYITISNTGSILESLAQFIEFPLLYAGKTVTLSVKLSDGNIYAGTITLPSSGAVDMENIVLGATNFIADIYTTDISRSLWVRFVEVAAAAAINVESIKLELGPISTLANDAPSDYGDQLALCKRFYRIWTTSAARAAALTELYLMRIASPSTGTIAIGGVTYYYADANL